MPVDVSEPDETFPANRDGLHPDRRVESLTRLPVLSRCSRQELVRIVPYLRKKRLQPGEFLCRAGQPTRESWLLLQGTLLIDRAAGASGEVSEGLVGEEAAIDARSYISDIVAKDEATVLVVPKAIIPDVLKCQGNREYPLWGSLLERFTASQLPIHVGEGDSVTSTPGTVLYKTMGWIAAIVLPFLVLGIGDASGLRWEQTQMAVALTSTVMLWLFRLTPPYVAGLFLVLFTVTLGIVPNKVILSGFTSNSFFMALSVFGLGAVLVKSGVIARGMLLILRSCPHTPFWSNFMAMLMGIILTPLLLSVQDRAKVLAPILADSSQSLGYATCRRDATRLALSMFMGATLFSPVLLTGGPLNLALYGSLPEQVQHGFPWLQWTIAASVAAGVMLVAYTGLSVWVFHKTSRPRLSYESIQAQLQVLGPMGGTEWMSLGGVLFFFAALMTPSAHQIDHRLIGLILVAIYLVMDVLKSDQINIDIDWSFLVLLGTLIGMINTVAYVDLDRFGAERLPWLSQIIKTQPHLFIAILSAIVFVARLLIPAAGALVALFFIPITVVNGMNPWVVAFVILMMQDCWLMPCQSSSYRTFRSIVRLHNAYDERLFLRINAATVVIRMVAIAVSLFYWQQVHIL